MRWIVVLAVCLTTLWWALVIVAALLLLLRYAMVDPGGGCSSGRRCTRVRRCRGHATTGTRGTVSSGGDPAPRPGGGARSWDSLNRRT